MNLFNDSPSSCDTLVIISSTASSNSAALTANYISITLDANAAESLTMEFILGSFSVPMLLHRFHHVRENDHEPETTKCEGEGGRRFSAGR